MSDIADILGHDDQAWMKDGLCADSLYADNWFPSEVNETQARGEALCGGCPSRVPCLRYALADPSLEGIWAGTTTSQRKSLRREMNLPKPLTHGTYGGYLRHRRNNEEACADCKTACAERSRRKRQQGAAA